ncbi:hypothetical protein CC85DRAFT_5704 [Cutaneotrichosporon oleaginosum]|uniref:Uncharacterized protein n=1 Tax=Cutaneotrichosporon oleaginosum TaxID=879819 RepID=A0A0J0XZT3_9TREE|nr:uncharacterized protein CC85DRAFT_5704 [Cutaneotrichosporon oleaginosum]KLT46557.1 hypothetical protein CC85DRAFT_5704 [Cutaneotrichosporon oleaginosum]TXT15076.1 hypothetical protein COLE_01269 [Cutaneotrichosporon oleaginosum]
MVVSRATPVVRVATAASRASVASRASPVPRAATLVSRVALVASRVATVVVTAASKASSRAATRAVSACGGYVGFGQFLTWLLVFHDLHLSSRSLNSAASFSMSLNIRYLARFQFPVAVSFRFFHLIGLLAVPFHSRLRQRTPAAGRLQRWWLWRCLSPSPFKAELKLTSQATRAARAVTASTKLLEFDHVFAVSVLR